MYDFAIERPSDLASAVALLKDEGAMALAGGQTLIPTLKQRLAAPQVLVSLSGISELRYVRREGDVLAIGAGTTHADVASKAAQDYPALAALAGQIGDMAVRNRGTIGGSVANNDPSACYPAAVLASGATIVTNTRSLSCDAFFQGMFTTALAPGELVTGLQFPIPKRACYVKMPQPASRFALVGAFVAAFDNAVRVAVTGASEEGVFRWTAAEDALGGDFKAAALEGVDMEADGLIGDIHASPEYRAHLVKVLTKRAVAGALAA